LGWLGGAADDAGEFPDGSVDEVFHEVEMVRRLMRKGETSAASGGRVRQSVAGGLEGTAAKENARGVEWRCGGGKGEVAVRCEANFSGRVGGCGG
jgi:hypothetical protein